MTMAEGNEQIKNIWMLSREYGEFAGVGGVKDVVSQLAENLARWTSRSVSVVMPLYGFMDVDNMDCVPVADPACQFRPLRIVIPMHEPQRMVTEVVTFFLKKIQRVNLYLVKAERFVQKSAVYTYSEEDEARHAWQKKAMGHHDFFAMNLLLQKAALELIVALGEKPDIIHCHDGHTALVPALIREIPGYASYFRTAGCLLTIHNAGLGYHQEIVDIPYAQTITALPRQLVDEFQLDLKFDPLLIGSCYGVVNTVSENYARELQASEADNLTGWLGHKLFSRGVTIEGITNGIDPLSFPVTSIGGGDKQFYFNPADGRDDLSGKKMYKHHFLESLASAKNPDSVNCYGSLQINTEWPLFTFIGRLSEQKGVDLLLRAVEVQMMREPRMQLLVLGEGANDYESRLIRLTGLDGLRGRTCFLQGYNPELALQVYAAGDFFLIPSRYEPCGLTDFIAQLHGNIPVVHHVGGLVKVIDGVTGIGYQGNGYDDLISAMQKALHLFARSDEKRRIQLQSAIEIEEKYTWRKVMKKYLVLYQRAKLEQLTRICNES